MAAPKINNVENTTNEASDLEKFDPNMMNSYEELSEKCDVVIKKIKNRKSKIPCKMP